MTKLVINYDILALTETWLGENESLKIKGYKYIGKNRTKINKMGRNPGGICFLINNVTAKFVTEIKTKHEESLWIRVKNDKKIFFNFCVVYQHPVTSKLYNEKLYENLEEEINLINEKFKNYEICLLGDFNARIGELDTYKFMNEYYNLMEGLNRGHTERKSKDKVVNREGEKLLEFCLNNELFIANGNVFDDLKGEYTYVGRNGASVNDYILVSNSLSKYIECFRITDIVSSNHMLLSMKFRLEVISTVQEIQGKEKNKSFRKTIIWREEKRENFENKIRDTGADLLLIGIEQSIKLCGIEEALKILYHMIYRVGESVTKNGMAYRGYKNFYDEECNKKKKGTQRLV